MNFYFRDGQLIRDSESEVATLIWAKLFEDDEYRSVAFTEGRDWSVSTIWMGFDMRSLVFDGLTPLIFETLVRTPLASDTIRYTTEEDALRNHAELSRALLEAEEIAHGS